MRTLWRGAARLIIFSSEGGGLAQRATPDDNTTFTKVVD